MHNPITQQHAEQLLEGATPGPWMYHEIDGYHEVLAKTPDRPTFPVLCDTYEPEDAELMAASPDLAHTVIWLWKQNQQQQARVERLQTGFKAALEEVNDLSEETYNHMAGPFLPATPSDYRLEPGDLE